MRSLRAGATFGRLFLLLATAARLASVQGNMRAPAFGKLRWGQDNTNVFITAYVPGVSVTDDVPEFTINNSHFKLEATNPQTSEVYNLEFEFREDVNASGLVQRHSTWKYGNQNNSLFAVIPKLEQGHLFDRLYAQKPDKKLKFAIEKDWDRYTVSDDMMENDDEDEDEDDDADIVKLTDANFEARTKDKTLSIFRVYYPWCGECKKDDAFQKAATSKRGRRVAKKYNLLYGAVDAREESKTRRKVGAMCKQDQDSGYTCTDYLYMKPKDSPAVKWPSSSFSISEVLKRTGPIPRPLSTRAELVALQKDTQEKTLVLGLFDKAQHAEAAEAFAGVATAQTDDYFFASMEEAKLVGTTINDMIVSLVGADCAPSPMLQAPAILMLRNFSTDKLDDGYSAFGGFAGAGADDKDEFTAEKITDFLTENSNRKLERKAANTQSKPTDSAGKRTVVRLFVADGNKAKADLKTFRCAMQMLHREAIFEYHDERVETGKPVIGSNMSEVTKTALLDYGLAGQPRPLVVVDQIQEDDTVKHYSLRLEKSANYLTRQIRRAAAGSIPAAVRSEPVPVHAPTTGKVGTAVGSTLAETFQGSDVLLQLVNERPAPQQLSLLEADKLAKALEQAGSKARVVFLNPSKNDCNFTDPRFPSNLAELTANCKSAGTVFVPVGKDAVKFDAVNPRAGPALQFVSDHSEDKFDVAKAQEHVKELDQLCTVTLHQHGSRTGTATVFRIGSYTMEQMVAAGAANDDTSSLSVEEGCQVTLYENGDFSGWNATFEPGQYTDQQLSVAGAHNDQTSSLQVKVFVPPMPPVQSEAPVASVNEDGDITVTWKIPEPQEGVSKPTSYSVYSSVTKNGAGEVMKDPVPTLRSGGLSVPEAKTQSWSLQFNEGTFERGSEIVFQVKPVAKVGAGNLSSVSNVIVMPEHRKSDPAEAASGEEGSTEKTSAPKDEV